MELVVSQTNRTKMVQIAYGVLLWFFLALGGSILGSFIPARGTPPLVFGLVIAVPVLLFVVGYLFSRTWREFVSSLIGDPWGITALQGYRVLGVVFLVLASRKLLPAIFALPAGLGDIFVGITAPLVALAWSAQTRSGKVVFVLWNLLGIVDLLTALSLGFLASVMLPGATNLVVLFPLSLIPTFAVPLSLCLHVAGLGQLWRLQSKQAA